MHRSGADGTEPLLFPRSVRSRTFRCDHVYRALGVCQFFYGMSIFQTPNIPDSLVQFNFYIGVLALSAEYQQPVRHCRSL